MAQTLRGRRHECGALELETIQARPVFEGDHLKDLAADTRNRAKELIEDLMISANSVTARYLASPGTGPPCGESCARPNIGI